MRSYNLPFKYPFKITTTLLFIILLFSTQNIFAQSGWQSTFSNNVFIINNIIKADSLNYFAFSSSNKNYLRSTNGGNNWISSPELTLDTTYVFNDWQFLNSNTGWIVGSTVSGDIRSVFFKTTDGGQNWIKKTGISAYSFTSICFTDDSNGWIGSRRLASDPISPLLKTTNGGENWNEVLVPQTYSINHLKFFNSNYGWILHSLGYLCKTTNSGQNWISDTTFKHLFLYDIATISESECWLLTRDGFPLDASRIYKTTNGGINWTLKLTSSNPFVELRCLNSQTAFVYGGKVLFKTTNGGNSWDSIYVSSSYSVNSILPVDRNTIIAGGGQNVTIPPNINMHSNIIKTSNSGENWSQNYYNRNYNFNDITFKDSQNGLVIESNASVLRTTNGGNEWVKIYESSSVPLYFIKYLCDTNVIIGSSSGRILRTTNFGNNWTTINTRLNSQIHKAIFFDELTGYTLGGAQYIQRTSNGGLNWDSIYAPIGNLLGSSTPYSDMDFINSSTGWLCSATNIVAGGHGVIYENQIKKTTNGGLNWSLMYSSGSSVQYLKLKFFNENTGWSWKGSNIYVTSDGGSTWNLSLQYPNSSIDVIYLVNANICWAIGTYASNVAICKTTNAGMNWFLQCSTTNDYNKKFTSMFIQNNDVAWACGGGNTIFKTTNGGGIISAINPISTNISNTFSLSQNYPNPFNPTTKINFDLKNSVFAMLRVYDITGREVRTLVNEKLSAGSYSYDFNASELPSGVYFYQLQTEGFEETKKMILLK